MLKTDIQQYVYWNKKSKFLMSQDIDAYWIMYIIDKGVCQYKIDSIEGVAQAGDILICPPYTNFQREVIKPLNFHFFRFSLKNELIEPKRMIASIAISDRERLKSTCDMFKSIQYDNALSIKELRNHLLVDILFMYFYDHSTIVTNTKEKIKDDLINEATLLLSDTSSKAKTITEIAEHLNLNPCHFSRKFKQIMSASPIEYRNKIKLQEAQRMLIETNDTIETIAEKCGYGNAFYFSRIFSKFMGEAPSSYRNNHEV